MQRKHLFFILISSIMLFLINGIALKYDLYTITPHFDAVSHTFGGIVVASMFLYTLAFKNIFPKKVAVIFFVFIIGIIWEIFELETGQTHSADAGYFLDTSSDLFFDLFGAFFTYYFISKKIYERN